MKSKILVDSNSTAISFDGVLTYSVEEMNVLISNLNNKENFNWEVGRVKSGPTKILYLLGGRSKN